MDNFRITEEVVVAHTNCERKSYLMLFQHSQGNEKPYAALIREKRQEIESHFLGSTLQCLSFYSDQLTGKAKFILNATFHAGDFLVNSTHLEKRESCSKLGDFCYEPLIISNSNKITIEV